jgi:hypothetical protein
MLHSKTFGILLKPSLAMIPKHYLILMSCSSITKIYKNCGAQEAIVSKFEKQLIDIRIPRLGRFPGISLTVSPL